MVEQGCEVPRVGGSIPSRPTMTTTKNIDKPRKPRLKRSPTGGEWTRHKPYRPSKPKETIKSDGQPILVLDLYEYGEVTINEEQRNLLAQATRVKIGYVSIDRYDTNLENVEVNFYSDELEIPNPNYDTDMERYREDMEVYNAEMAWWKEEKVKMDAYQKELDAYNEHLVELREREQLRKLQERYGVLPQ